MDTQPSKLEVRGSSPRPPTIQAFGNQWVASPAHLSIPPVPTGKVDLFEMMEVSRLAASRFDVRSVDLVCRFSIPSPLPRRIGTGEPCSSPPSEHPETLRQAATVVTRRPLVVGGSGASLEGVAISPGHRRTR